VGFRAGLENQDSRKISASASIRTCTIRPVTWPFYRRLPKFIFFTLGTEVPETGLDARMFLLIGHIYDVIWQSEGVGIQSLSAVNITNKASKFTITRESIFM